MQKSGIKSFIFSFVLTLSAVILVDKTIPSAPKNIEQPKKISYKNIALFSDKKDDIIVVSATKSSDIKPAKQAEIYAEDENVHQSATETVYEETVATNEKNTLYSDNSELTGDETVVYNPDKVVAQAKEEYSFEELMALNNISDSSENSVESVVSEDEVIIAQKDTSQENTDNYKIADTSFDESINLWMPIEKGSAEISMAKTSEFSQVAMSDASVMLSSVMDKEKAKKDSLGDAISVAKSANDQKVVIDNNSDAVDSPWIEAKGSKHTKNRLVTKASSEKVTDKKSFSLNKITDDEEVKKVSGILNKYPENKPKGSVDVAYKVMDNLIIPIPEEILQDDNLTPQLVSEAPKEDTEVKEKKKKSSKKESKTEKKKSSLFESIGSFFSSSKKKKNKGDGYEEYTPYSDEEDEDDEDEEGITEEDAVDENKGVINENGGIVIDEFQQFLENSEILPTEIKLSFQPEKAEISGSTLRWIRAFAENAKKDKSTYIEIRIDGSGAFALQQRRLNLLNGVFLENGVSSDKINTVFTSREPNSFVIRNIKVGNDKQEKEINKKKSDPYYQIW